MKPGLAIFTGIIGFLLWASTSAVAQILPEDPSKGAQLFKSKGCVTCHAIQGEGGTIGPDLARIYFGETQLDLVAAIWNHTPAMVAGIKQAGITYQTLTGQEITEITTYLYFLRFFDQPGTAAAGEVLFDQKGCMSCHPVLGRGRDGAPGIDEFPRNASPVFLSQAMWNHSLRMMARMVRIGKRWPDFNETEMMDTIAYIRTRARGEDVPEFIKAGSPKAGKAVFTAKGCANCHSIHGEGVKEGVDLGRRAESFYTSLSQIASSMWNKAPEMMLFTIASTQCGVPRFEAKEMADLLAYLYFLHYTDEPGNASRGKKIFSSAGCAQCHSLTGEQGKLMSVELSKYRNSQPADIVAGIWNHRINMSKAATEKGISWPRLKSGEMKDLLEFIRASIKK